MKILIDNGHGIETKGKRSPEGRLLEYRENHIISRGLDASLLVPAVLVENLFMDNPSDCAFLLSPEGQQSFVDLHVDGIISHLDSL